MSPEHLVIAPILIPFFAGAVMLFYEDRQRRLKTAISVASAAALLITAVSLLIGSEGTRATGGNDVGVYLLGNWPPPFAIVLVLDRLSALMLLLTACLALPVIAYAGAGWEKQGRNFHSILQFLLMGLNGAFLTGDLFNLFVFFEVLLAASYGLVLHGSGALRVRAGLHYIAVNLVASLFFLIGVSLIYGVTGTLNMADLAMKIPLLSEADRMLVLAASAILGVVFLVKAGMWPLAFWLPGAYTAASAPVGAIFAIMTKVGLYIVLRLSTLLYGWEAEVAPGFGAGVLVVGGMATLIFGTLGILAAQGLARVASHAIIVSAGTILASIGISAFAGPGMISGALYYMLASTLACAALFLLAELMEREQGSIASLLAVTSAAYGFGDEDPEDDPDEGGLGVPGAQTVLALSFAVVTLILAGLPPFAGFLGKVALIAGALGPAARPVPAAIWVFVGLLLVSGLATLIALMRIGIHTFWTADEESRFRIRALEMAPVLGLVGLAVLLTVEARPALRYLGQTAEALAQPSVYTNEVLTARQSKGFLDPPEDEVAQP